ncbi:hypothetical protein G6F66_014914 [Rhizopus arrhizus]|nr:hypothetical protein G6F66_014914 [Rhizopus arrhizus]
MSISQHLLRVPVGVGVRSGERGQRAVAGECRRDAGARQAAGELVAVGPGHDGQPGGSRRGRGRAGRCAWPRDRTHRGARDGGTDRPAAEDRAGPAAVAGR